jgi:hypothetical protein
VIPETLTNGEYYDEEKQIENDEVNAYDDLYGENSIYEEHREERLEKERQEEYNRIYGSIDRDEDEIDLSLSDEE